MSRKGGKEIRQERRKRGRKGKGTGFLCRNNVTEAHITANHSSHRMDAYQCLYTCDEKRKHFVVTFCSHILKEYKLQTIMLNLAQKGEGRRTR